ncbi:MAG: ATP-binding protein [Bacteroidales bacterium]|nr:ATP-binding protein [Bacteroidales bacterium]
MKNLNPFIIGRYESESYFCNRESEIKRLSSAFENQRNITLISPRRLGKTGLILHFFKLIEQEKDFEVFYIDLMHTRNLEQFIKTFAKAVIGEFDNRVTKLITSFTNIVKSLRPNITVDPMTGKPTIDVHLNNENSKETSIEEIFSYLKVQNKKIIIAFDEFQQINNYPEKGTEALLRSQIQQILNTTFIYSGSQKHLLMSMFGEYKRPFYQSSEFLNLEKIGRNVYKEFIIEKFERGKRSIDAVAVDLILDLTETYTWYVQFLCNKLYGLNVKKINNNLVIETLINILKEQEVIFYNYRNLLTAHQFGLLKAIAMEGLVKMPTSKDFIQKYKLSAASTIKTNLDSLIKKEMILVHEAGYKVYDVFFAQWLKRFNI